MPRVCHRPAVHTAVTSRPSQPDSATPPSPALGRAPPRLHLGRRAGHKCHGPLAPARGSAVQASAQWGNPGASPYPPTFLEHQPSWGCSPRLRWVTSTEGQRGHGWKREPGRPGGTRRSKPRAHGLDEPLPDHRACEHCWTESQERRRRGWGEFRFQPREEPHPTTHTQGVLHATPRGRQGHNHSHILETSTPVKHKALAQSSSMHPAGRGPSPKPGGHGAPKGSSSGLQGCCSATGRENSANFRQTTVRQPLACPVEGHSSGPDPEKEGGRVWAEDTQAGSQLSWLGTCSGSLWAFPDSSLAL